MSWFWTVIFLSFTFSSHLSEATHHNKLPSAVIVGTVYCDTCFKQDFPQASRFIAGASVAVECSQMSSRQGFRQEVKTDSHGEFRVHLPFSVGENVKKIRGCSVTLIRSNEPFCAVAATATSSSFHLKSRKEGTHIFSAGFFTFKPLKQPQVCDQKPNIKNFKKSAEKKLSPISNKKNAAKPSQFSFPFPLNPLNPPSIFPPNPFQPPPSIIPPIFPSPPPSIFPPILPAPPSPPFFHLPPLPGLFPSPPPPPPPIFPIPLPPLPLPPIPGFPGVPPAHDVSSQSGTSSP